MARTYGTRGPAHPWIGAAVYRLQLAASTAVFARSQVYRAASPYARDRANRLAERLGRGETVYLLGLGAAGHNTGAALVEVSAAHGVRLIANEEEERYSAIKHCTTYPRYAIDAVLARLRDLGVPRADVHACLATWDYPAFNAMALRLVAEHFPRSLALMSPDASPKFNHVHTALARSAPARLGRQMGIGRPMPLIALRHHDNHAWFSWAVSPFARSPKPTLVTVIDGFGDDASVSVYLGHHGRLTLIRSNASMFDSLGGLYGLISSTQGGWTMLSSEGRYMGAAAWGDGNRLTNPYYSRLREILSLGADGEIYLNRSMTNWQCAGERAPYDDALRSVLGEPVPPDKLWNPDAVLDVDDIAHSDLTRDRVDKAAATQLVFEDALFHLVGHFIRTTGADQLVLTGGTALNCVANMRLLDAFDESYYRRRLGVDTRLHLWVPPTPGDAGVTAGAAFHFALAHGASVGEPLRHAFYCGTAPRSAEIRAALAQRDDIGSLALGEVGSPEGRAHVADFMAFALSRGGVLGNFQGPAETGPRALGHRSIVANPCDADALALINQRVKRRERIRPLAPMATMAAARRLFELSPGASDDDYNAYNYMVLTARARPEARALIPAVVHQDGTSRVQIVREPTDPFTYAFLLAMGRHVGVEVAVNTSLNVGSPIVQTPVQALEVLRRAKALSGIVLIGDDGEAWLAWHTSTTPPKDGGAELLAWHASHREGRQRVADP
jgi:carbamoyltransferase